MLGGGGGNFLTVTRPDVFYFCRCGEGHHARDLHIGVVRLAAEDPIVAK